MTSEIERYQAEIYRGNDAINEGMVSFHESSAIAWSGVNEAIRASRDLVDQSSERIDRGVGIIATAMEGSSSTTASCSLAGN